ncbi:hypothetical protein HA402_005139 [Bradysia odoriphaga]|nr:hypothetical protein HA402_005139 [Bradysia odoriphaga]
MSHFSTGRDIKSVQGQRVDVQPRNVTALEGEKADILCRWGTPLQYCRRYIQASDDRRTLICRSHHIADRGQPQEARMQFQVRFQPQPLPEIKVYGVILGSDAVINATIKANPRPRTEWIVDGIAIPQGTQNGRYESYEPIDLGGGVFNVSLTIASLTLEDTTKMYYLKASNEFGTQEYSVRISSSEAAAVNGLDTAAIIGIVVGVAVLIIIVVLVVVARATGKWCFAGKGNTSSKPQGSETSDTESADLKQNKFKKYQINFEGLFKKKPQKVVDVEKNNAEAPADDPNDDAAPSEATVIIEDDPPKSGDKNLVYAELMLKPSEDANNPNKNATEYAEIVYVNPPSDQKQPDKK